MTMDRDEFDTILTFKADGRTISEVTLEELQAPDYITEFEAPEEPPLTEEVIEDAEEYESPRPWFEEAEELLHDIKSHLGDLRQTLAEIQRMTENQNVSLDLARKADKAEEQIQEFRLLTQNLYVYMEKPPKTAKQYRQAASEFRKMAHGHYKTRNQFAGAARLMAQRLRDMSAELAECRQEQESALPC